MMTKSRIEIPEDIFELESSIEEEEEIIDVKSHKFLSNSFNFK